MPMHPALHNIDLIDQRGNITTHKIYATVDNETFCGRRVRLSQPGGEVVTCKACLRRMRKPGDY